jgi:DNA-binding NarL/FixJ family response regulator
MSGILIAENDDLHRGFARRIIAQVFGQNTLVLEAETGRQALQIADENTVSHAILDLQLPITSGVDVARALWERHPDTKILFWSNFADEAYVRALDRIVPAQASYGYLLKSAPEEELCSTLEAVFLRERRVVDRQIKVVQSRLANRFAGLSDTEYEGLIDIALGLTDKMIAKRRRLSVRGVQNRLRQIYEKLETANMGDPSNALYNSRTRSITLAFERGLLNYELLRREQDKLDEWLLNSR